MQIQYRRRLFAGLLLSFALISCAKKQVIKQHVQGPVNAWAIAVYPMVFRIPVSPYQSFDRARRMAESVSEQTGKLVYGPGEYRIDDIDSDDLVRGTSLNAALPFTKERTPEGVYAVRVVVAQRVSSGESQGVDPTGKSRKRRMEERIEVAVRAELLSMKSRSIIAEAEDVTMVDPFSEEMDQDPFPDVTRLTKVLVDAILQDARLMREKPAASIGLTVMSVPRPAMAWAPVGTVSLLDEWGKLDALESDAKWIGLIQSIDAAAPRARFRALKNAPHGLVVVNSDGAAQKAGLEADDLIVAADGENLVGRYVLDRHLASGKTMLTVRRAGEDKQVVLNAPPH